MMHARHISPLEHNNPIKKKNFSSLTSALIYLYMYFSPFRSVPRMIFSTVNSEEFTRC